MIRKIPFEVFGEGQYLRFDIGRFMIVEQIAKRSIGDLLSLQRGLDLSTLTVLLSVGVRSDRENRGKSPEWYATKIQEFLEAGHEMDEIQGPVMKAVIATGILGRKAYLSVFPEDATEKKTKQAEEEEKND